LGKRSIDPDVTERHQRVEIDLVGEFVPVGYVGETKIPAGIPVPESPVPEFWTASFCFELSDLIAALQAFAMLVYNDRGLPASDRTFH
jgi:hypothetical protein